MQAVADRNNTFGTFIAGGDEEVWIGSPLLVLRRCVEPMFSILNTIAYDGGMVLGDGKAEQERRIPEGDPARSILPRPLLGPSRWIDMQTDRGGVGHLMFAHAEMAAAIVREFMVGGWAERVRPDGMPDLYVISPSRTAADGLRLLLSSRRDRGAPGAPRKAVDTWLHACVGTVHTFQGKEAEAVVLLLGGKTAGAIHWAAGTPNVLDVAVTRAKRRLYVVGDWDAWMRELRVRSAMGSIEGFHSSTEAMWTSFEAAATPTSTPARNAGLGARSRFESAALVGGGSTAVEFSVASVPVPRRHTAPGPRTAAWSNLPGNAIALLPRRRVVEAVAGVASCCPALGPQCRERRLETFLYSA